MKFSNVRKIFDAPKTISKYVIEKTRNSYIIHSVHESNKKIFGSDKIDIPMHRTHELDAAWDLNQLQIFEDKLTKLIEVKPNREMKRKNAKLRKKFAKLANIFTYNPEDGKIVSEESLPINQDILNKFNEQVVLPSDAPSIGAIEQNQVIPESVTNEENK